MKKYILLFLSALILFASCTKDVVPVLTVTLDKQQQSLAIGQSFVLRAIISPSNAGNQKVIWIVSNSSISLVDNGDGTAKVSGESAGTAQVIVKTDDGGVEDVCTVVVGAAVESLALDKTEIGLRKGESILLSATVSPSDASNKTVVWGSSDPDVVSVDAEGKVSALAGGEATVYASTADGGFVATCHVVVDVPVESITLSEYTKDDVYVGQSFPLVVTVNPDDATDAEIIWSSSDSKVAVVSSDGVVTAVGPGSATVTASSRGLSAECSVNVLLAADHVHLSDTVVTILAGHTKKISAKVFPVNSTDSKFTWESNNVDVATVDPNGVITARRPGEAIIKVSVNAYTFAECRVIVKILPEALVIDPSTLSVKPGEKFQLNCLIYPESASEKEVSWKSDNPTVAAVSSSGVITGVGPGKTNVHVLSSSNPELCGTCEVSVVTPVAGITLSKSSLELFVGEGNGSVSATVKPSDATNKALDWESSDPSVASVAEGESNTVVITPVKASSKAVNVIARSVDDTSVTATCVVTVKQHVKNLTLSKDFVEMYVGDNESIEVTISPDDATGKSVEWTSSDKSVVSVSDGRLTALKAGEATVTVKALDGSNVNSSCRVVVRPHVSSVTLSKTSFSLALNSSAKLEATVLPADAPNKGVSWSSDNSSVVTVYDDGYVIAKSVGSAVITVTTLDQGKTSTCLITVVPPISGISLDKTTLSLNAGSSEQLNATVNAVDGADTHVVWSSSDNSVASVDDFGKVTGHKAGTALIIATSSDPSKTASCVVTVLENTIEATSLEITPKTKVLRVGETFTLGLTVLPLGAAAHINWFNNNPSVVLLQDDGIIMAKGVGKATIVARDAEDKLEPAICEVTVVGASDVTSLTLNQNSLTLGVNESFDLVATVLPENSSAKVNWSSDDPSVAEVDSEGKVKAKSAGSATITAVAGSRSATCVVTVESEIIEVTSLTFSEKTINMAVGESKTLVITVSPEDANENPKFAQNTGSPATFVVSHAVGTPYWYVTFTAYRDTDGTFAVETAKLYERVKLKGYLQHVESLDINIAKTVIRVGESIGLIATVNPSNASNKVVNWTSSDTSVATVNSAGVVTAKRAGFVTITAKSQDGGYEKTCELLVRSNTVDPGNSEGVGFDDWN